MSDSIFEKFVMGFISLAIGILGIGFLVTIVGIMVSLLAFDPADKDKQIAACLERPNATANLDRNGFLTSCSIRK